MEWLVIIVLNLISKIVYNLYNIKFALETEQSCSNCRISISRRCLKKDRDGQLSPASGCKGWSTQNGGICCEPEKEKSSIWGTVGKILGGVAAGAGLMATG